MKRTILGVAAALVLAPAALAMHHEVTPVEAAKAPKLGTLVFTTKHLAVYTWNREKDGRVHCTGACAKAWPPVTVMKDDMVARHAKGVMGTLGTITRPDGRVQVTLNGRPLYTYSGDTPTKILCNGVNGWFVVRA